MPLTAVAYITTWCPDCSRSRRVLQQAGVPFVEIDIETVKGAEDAMRALNEDSGKIPTIVLESPQGRKVLVEPTDRELTTAILALE